MTFSTLSSSEPHPLGDMGQVILILSGLVGSGKSTFAQELERHFPNFVRCNQDELGRRQDVEFLARSCLDKGKSVCIDRTNVDAGQRAHWVRIARERPQVHIWLIVFDIPIDVCIERLRYRTSHPTIHTPEMGIEILSRFAHQFRHPHPSEGYDRILTLTPNDQPPTGGYSADEIMTILLRIHESPQVVQQEPSMLGFQGSHTGYRGQRYPHTGGFRGGRIHSIHSRGGRGWHDGWRGSSSPSTNGRRTDRW